MTDDEKPIETVDEDMLQNADTEPIKAQEIEKVVETEGKDEMGPLKQNFFKRFVSWYKTNKKLAVPLTAIVLLGIIMAVSLTRYKVLGLVIKKSILIYTVDSKTKSIVYNSNVTIDGKKPFCGGDKPPYPNCFAKVPLGKHKLKVEAAFYAPVEKDITIGLSRSKEKNVQVEMGATGSEVHIAVSNKITGQPLKNVHVKAGNSETLTTEFGGYIFVDFSAKSVDVELSYEGYNPLKTTIKIVPGQVSQENTKLALSPIGKIYFLSKRSGKIDVVKTDLDGSNRQTVLAGTGQEEDTNTILLASRDWKYLALLSRRESDKARLYLIDTSKDKLTEMDSGDSAFSPVGWHDHYFVYSVYHNNVPLWQPRANALKTFNAENLQTSVLDETSAEGSGDNEYITDSLENIYINKDGVVYTKRWYGSYYSIYRLAGKRMGIYSVKLGGSGKQVLKDFDVGNNGYITAVLYKPDEIYFSVTNLNTSFYEYEDGAIKETKAIDNSAFGKFYPTYLLSPGGQKTLWYEPRDGKNTLFTGMQDGGNPKELASLSEYIPYGWYSDDYLLVSKNGSELFIMPAADSGAAGNVLKVTDYHKPNTSFRGYGYGYGGF